MNAAPRGNFVEALESRLQFAGDILITQEDGSEIFTTDPSIGTEPAAPQIDFGRILKNQQATAKAFFIRNVGSEVLNVGELTLPKGFFLVESPPTQIAPGESGRVVIGINTETAGEPTGTLVIASDDPDEPLIQFGITGSVLEPSPISLVSLEGRFSSTVIAGNSARGELLEVTIRNDSDAKLVSTVSTQVFLSFDATLDDSDLVLGGDPKRVRLAPGRERTLKIHFPTESALAGEYTVIASVSAEGAASVSMAGPQMTIEAPFIRLTHPTSIAAVKKVLPRGKRAALKLALTNEGNVPTGAVPTNFALRLTSGADIVFETPATSHFRLAPAKTKTIKVPVTFPTDAFAAGDYELEITLNSDDSRTDEPLATLPVQFL
jgi:hypothetical protein